MAWAATFELGFFEPQSKQDYAALSRGEKLRRVKSRRGNLYRAVAKYIVNRMVEDRPGEYYVSAPLACLFWSGPFAGNYFWPILQRPAGASVSAVYNRRIHTRRGQGNEASFPEHVQFLQFRDQLARARSTR